MTDGRIAEHCDYFLFARQNEAAGAADTAAWMMSAVVIFRRG